MVKRILLLISISAGFTLNSYAQHETNKPAHEKHITHAKNDAHGMKGTHRLSIGLGHTHISEGRNEVTGKLEWLAAASWSLNYDYWLSNKLGIGLQNDLILESFIIEDHHNEIIERNYPISVIPVVLYKPGKHLSLIGGVGAEFSQGHTLTLTRLGAEYGFHIPGNWEVGAAVVWDGKWNYYNSWAIAFTFSKLWPKKKH